MSSFHEFVPEGQVKFKSSHNPVLPKLMPTKYQVLICIQGQYVAKLELVNFSQFSFLGRLDIKLFEQS